MGMVATVYHTWGGGGKWVTRAYVCERVLCREHAEQLWGWPRQYCTAYRNVIDCNRIVTMLARDRGHPTAERRSSKSVHTQCSGVSSVTGGSVEYVVIASMCCIKIRPEWVGSASGFAAGVAAD